MTPSQILLKLVLDGTGQELQLDVFTQRLKVQKKIYLTQLTGLDLGYRFGWYLYGPYCRHLTSDAFRLREQIHEGVRDYEGKLLSPLARKLTAGVKTIWENTPEGVDEDDWLELLASLHYLKHISYWPNTQGRDFDDVYKELVESKPRFRERRPDALHAWQQLDRVGLIRHKVLPVSP